MEAFGIMEVTVSSAQPELTRMIQLQLQEECKLFGICNVSMHVYIYKLACKAKQNKSKNKLSLFSYFVSSMFTVSR